MGFEPLSHVNLCVKYNHFDDNDYENNNRDFKREICTDNCVCAIQDENGGPLMNVDIEFIACHMASRACESRSF